MRDPLVDLIAWIIVSSGTSCLLVVLFSAFASTNERVFMNFVLTQYDYLYIPAAIGAGIGFGIGLLMQKVKA